MRHARRRSQGFTLIELLVTLAIGTILMLVAAPSFVDYRRNSELSDAASSLVLAAGSAKSAALKSGRNVFVQAAVTADGWRSGWFVFSDTNWNNQYDAATDELIMQHEALSNDLTVVAGAGTPFADGYLMFSGAGFPRIKPGTGVGNGSVTLSSPKRSTTVIVDATGRIRSCKTGAPGCA
jgi:type IV fimbrial biogenesis protein FimT